MTNPSSSAVEEEFHWLANNVELTSFSTKHTWKSLRPTEPVQSWTSNVWYKGAIPKHAFHMWVTHLDRLLTRTRLLSWSLQIQPNCCLYDCAVEMKISFIPKCEVSEQLWDIVIKRIGYRPFVFHTWTAFCFWLGNKDKIDSRTLRRLVVPYYIWAERNNRLHNNISSTPESIFKLLDRLIHDAILAKRKRKAFKDLLQL